MSTARFSATVAEPMYRLPQTPLAYSAFHQPDDLPPVVVTRPKVLYRKQRTPGLEVVLTAAMLLVGALGAKVVTDSMQLRQSERPTRRTHQQEPQFDRVVVPMGQGTPSHTPAGTAANKRGGTGLPNTGSRQETSSADVSELVAKAVAACREGQFDTADSLGREAMQAAPKDSRGQAIRLLVAYLRQYSDLADQAVDRMNGAVEVDLGPRHGVGAFVDRKGDEVVFFVKGRHVSFSLAKFNSLDGVRFRVTRQFLENARQPANDLILGAVHYAKQLDDTGAFQPTGVAGRHAASARWKAASRSHDNQVASHARTMLSLLEGAGDRMGNAGQQ